MGTSFWLKWFMVELLLFKVNPSTALRRFSRRRTPSDRREESRVRDDDTSIWHGEISERPEDRRLHNGMHCQRPGANGCRLQLISGWLKTMSLWVRVMRL